MNYKGEIYIGTSNVVIPGNKETFPATFQSKSRLHYYSSLFNTVEINSSFYKIPQSSTAEKWSADVPGGFRFSLKLIKDITHIKDLQGDYAAIDRFMKFAGGIGEKKGCLLIQFPGKITLDYFKQVEQILQKMQEQDDRSEWKKAVEFRHASWYIRETWELLDEYGAAMVLQDIPKSRMVDVGGKAGFVYMRFHGPKGDYRDGYTDEFLAAKAKEMVYWTEQGKDVYVYFNNTIGSAFDNARSLQVMINPNVM